MKKSSAAVSNPRTGTWVSHSRSPAQATPERHSGSPTPSIAFKPLVEREEGPGVTHKLRSLAYAWG